MIPVVSNKYRYIFFYNPKSACSVARKLFLDLHRDELSAEQTAGLNALREANQDEWHTVNTLFPYVDGTDYSDYFKFTLVRHPATRIVSAYLNRVVLQQSDLAQIEAALKPEYGDNSIGFSFDDFLAYLKSQSATAIENRHFLPQSRLHGSLSGALVGSQYHRRFYKQKAALKSVFGIKSEPIVHLDGVCKIESLNTDLAQVYSHIFRNHPQKMNEVEQMLNALPIHNATFVSEQIEPQAPSLPAHVLRDRGQMPPYESFLNAQTLDQVHQLFSDDFALFDYQKSPDNSSREFEQKKNQKINAYVPKDFDWEHYVNVNEDLINGGINNKALALNHWIHHGRFEDREYKKG